MARRLALASVFGLILGFGAVHSASATSVRDGVGLRKCLTKTHAAFRTNADCTGYLERRGISNEEMDKIKSCIAQHRQYVNADCFGDKAPPNSKAV